MANPQPEDGYTRFANELIEAMARYNMSGRDWQVLLCLARCVYGWRGKYCARLSHSDIAQKTGINRRHIGMILADLITRNLIKIVTEIGDDSRVAECSDDLRAQVYEINKDYDSWHSDRHRNRCRSIVTEIGDDVAPEIGDDIVTEIGDDAPLLPLEKEKKEKNTVAHPSKPKPKKPRIDYAAIVTKLNEKTGKEFQPGTKATRQHINARFAEGFSIDDFFLVIDFKSSQWKTDAKFSEYLRPQTLFSSNFESYLQEAKRKKSNGGKPAQAYSTFKPMELLADAYDVLSKRGRVEFDRFCKMKHIDPKDADAVLFRFERETSA